MADKNTGALPAKNLSLKTALIAAGLAAVAGFVAVYVTLGGLSNDVPVTKVESSKPVAAGSSGLRAYAKGTMTAFVARAEPVDLPPIRFVNGENAETSIDTWKGKVVLLNLWATWCAPCRKEMPDLEKLKAELAGDDFDLVALSIDRTGLEKPRKFLEEIGVKHIELFNNSSGRLASSLKAFGMPTTLLLNRKGQELGRLVGPAEWDSPEAVALIKAAIAMKD